MHGRERVLYKFTTGAQELHIILLGPEAATAADCVVCGPLVLSLYNGSGLSVQQRIRYLLFFLNVDVESP